MTVEQAKDMIEFQTKMAISSGEKIEQLEKENEELKEQNEKLRLNQKTAYIKGMRHLTKALFEYDKKFGAQTDYFIHAIEIVLKQELDKWEVVE